MSLIPISWRSYGRSPTWAGLGAPKADIAADCETGPVNCEVEDYSGLDLASPAARILQIHKGHMPSLVQWQVLNGQRLYFPKQTAKREHHGPPP